MPELPDVTVYRESLERFVVGRIENIRITSPNLVRTFDPPWKEAIGKEIHEIRRLGKRLVFGLDEDLWLVLHLMIAGRLRWKKAGTKPPAKRGLATFEFEHGTLLLTEASPRKRASLHLVRGEDALGDHDPGGLDVFEASSEAFRETLGRGRHTLKRALTDPSILDAIGNAYSDEILHHAKLSPLRRTDQLDGDEIDRLHRSCREVLEKWIDLTREQVGDRFPDKVTAFRKEMAVHGKYGEPCPDCDTPVQRIAYADNETNYCPTCQTGGKLLADRALSQLMKGDWPKSLEELEERKRQ